MCEPGQECVISIDFSHTPDERPRVWPESFREQVSNIAIISVLARFIAHQFTQSLSLRLLASLSARLWPSKAQAIYRELVLESARVNEQPVAGSTSLVAQCA